MRAFYKIMFLKVTPWWKYWWLPNSLERKDKFVSQHLWPKICLQVFQFSNDCSVHSSPPRSARPPGSGRGPGSLPKAEAVCDFDKFWKKVNRCQFNQYFTSSYFLHECFTEILLKYSLLLKFLSKEYWRKLCYKML